MDWLWKLDSYTLIDIKPALDLTRTFLQCFWQRVYPKFLLPAEAEIEEADLLISNYAYSEIHRGTQEVYFSGVICRSERGYVTCNRLLDEKNSMPPEELCDRMNGTILSEVPPCYPGNCLVVWGNQR